MHFLLMTVLGGILFIFAIRLLVLGQRSRSWLPVDGKILNTIKVSESGPAERTQKMSHLKIQYQYAVNGQTFENDRVRFKWNHHNVVTESKKFIPGLTLKVYVNPMNPEQAVIEPGLDATNYIAFLGGVFFMSAGILLAIYA